MTLSSCCKPELITETKTVTVYVEKFRDYDFSSIRCGEVNLVVGETWLQLVINEREMTALCIADIESIKRTLNQ